MKPYLENSFSLAINPQILKTHPENTQRGCEKSEMTQRKNKRRKQVN